MPEQPPRGFAHLSSRIEVGAGLLSFTLAILIVGVVGALSVRETLGLVLLVVLATAALVAALWAAALRNGRAEKRARTRLQGEHAGALVERVRLWRLPHGRVLSDVPMHFLVADASEILFETIDQTVLLRIPVEALGFVGPVQAKGDRSRDLALTLIYHQPDGEQGTVQLFTVTYTGIPKLGQRIRTAIGWPPEGTPA